MSEGAAADGLHPVPPPTTPTTPRRPRHFGLPEWMLLLATVVWGTSFALAKEAGEAINHAAGVERHLLGPILVLALRFTIASLLLIAFIPAARHGWTRERLRDGLITGLLAAAGMSLLNGALDHTAEAVAAFLASCAVIVVPLLMWIAFRQRPAPAALLGVAVAVPGVWLMSASDQPTDLGGVRLNLGVWMGVASSIVLAGHLIAVGRLTPRVGTLRMCVAQFAICGIVCWLLVPLCAIRLERFDFAVFATHRFWLDLALLIALPTFVSFGLMARFQPLVSPVRAVMIYLFEPVAAAAFAWCWTGRTMTRWMIAGGALVLVANAIVELLPVVRPRRDRDTLQPSV